MLAPKDRILLLESLRPPPGFRLDTAVSTTFTLDLMALLVAPLAFTFFDWEGDDGEPTSNPNALLEAIRRHADRIHVFCQAGQIAVPSAYRMLFGYLESSVHEVRAVIDGGIFHPKVWIVRYVADGEPARYRLLCASRNLTFDRSWDTLLVLDGVAGDKALAKNEPLSRFIRSLLDMSVQTLPDNTQVELVELANEIDHVVFELPDHIEDIVFWPMGIPGAENVWPFPDKADRGLVISPFIVGSTLARLNISSEQTLVSRADELGALGQKPLESYEVFTLSDGADIDQEEGDGAKENRDNALFGLHAKLFAFDVGGMGYLWTGSANATSAAFHQNVEFLVEMRGQSKHMGVEAILCPQQKGMSVLQDLLEPFTPGPEAEVDPIEQMLEQMLMDVRRFIVDLEFGVSANQIDEDLFDLTLSPTQSPGLPEPKFDLQCWPASQKQETNAQVLSLDNAWSTVFSAQSYKGLTTFFAFEGRVVTGGQSATCRFMMNLPCSGFPENRRQHMLRFLLEDKQQLMRYLFLLLGEEGELSIGDITGSSRQSGEAQGEGFQADMPMLEALVMALERSPEKLDHVNKVVTELASTEDGRKLLPEAFDQIWSPLWKARQELKKNGR